ncbi:hypothetical protein P4377_28805 [Bacillus thuringiensis]|nr:hypothetical protein [Bacillus thuringiensis]
MNHNKFNFFVITLLGIIGFLFVPNVHAETEKMFQSNDFSTYGLGLKDTKINDHVPEYTPATFFSQNRKQSNRNNKGFPI